MRNILYCVFSLILIQNNSIYANKSYHIIDLRQDVLYSDMSTNDTTVYLYQRGKNGLIIMPQITSTPFPQDVSFRDTVIYNPAFLPVVFDGKILLDKLDFLPHDSVSDGYRLHLIPRDSTFLPLISDLEQVQSKRRAFYMDMDNVRNVRYNLTQLKKVPKIDESRVVKRNILEELISIDETVEISPLAIEQIKPELKYWSKTGEHSLQIAQNYISDNWYNGGNSSFFIRNYHKILLNYKKNKLTFNNVFEWKLSLQQTPADSIHKINISEDLIRIENTLGYQAFDHWSYSAKLESKTALFNSYPVNSNEKNTALFSPLTVNIGLGMSYTLDKSYENNITKKIKLTQNIAPFSVNYTYIADKSIDETRFGLDKGVRSKFEIGSLINTDLNFAFNKFMSWNSRVKYFTNYHRAEVEFENKFNMSLNRYLSTNITFYLRYDDSTPRNSEYGYFQINELVSFGLSYKW